MKLEENIAKKKTEQDSLEIRRLHLEEKLAANAKDESLQKEKDKLEKETVLCQAELAALIGQHQVESAKLLKRADVADYEKIASKLDEAVAERRKAMTEGK
ncbi:MAG: hypothetical protein KF713_16575 [Turneriella sp.]|nr:hypothetical protein [Turneriella sp.]